MSSNKCHEVHKPCHLPREQSGRRRRRLRPGSVPRGARGPGLPEGTNSLEKLAAGTINGGGSIAYSVVFIDGTREQRVKEDRIRACVLPDDLLLKVENAIWHVPVTGNNRLDTVSPALMVSLVLVSVIECEINVLLYSLICRIVLVFGRVHLLTRRLQVLVYAYVLYYST